MEPDSIDDAGTLGDLKSSHPDAVDALWPAAESPGSVILGPGCVMGRSGFAFIRDFIGVAVRSQLIADVRQPVAIAVREDAFLELDFIINSIEIAITEEKSIRPEDHLPVRLSHTTDRFEVSGLDEKLRAETRSGVRRNREFCLK